MKSRSLSKMLCLGALCLCSCKSVSYDVRPITQPVLLNHNPCISGKSVSPRNVVDVDTYHAIVAQSEFAAATSQNTTVSGQRIANDAQPSAFGKLAGQKDRVIHGLTLDVKYTAINGLIFLSQSLEVQADGHVAEVRP